MARFVISHLSGVGGTVNNEQLKVVIVPCATLSHSYSNATLSL